MGCFLSQIEKQPTLARCRDRCRFLKEVKSARNAFAAAHASYSAYLNNTGAALTDFVAAQFPASIAAPATIKGKSSVNLVEVFTDLDDHFLKASEAAHEVSRLLEATCLYHHYIIADNRGHLDYYARIFDGLDEEDHQTLGFDLMTRLSLGEKSHCDYVKAAVSRRFEYHRKVSQLDYKHTNSAAFGKAQYIVNSLQVACDVDMLNMESTLSLINLLRDQQLYPRLVQLADGMTTMWGVMHAHHEEQLSIVMQLGSLDISQYPTETSEHNYDRTCQLLIVLQQWHSQLEKLIYSQKKLIKALIGWLILNLVPIKSNMVWGNISSEPSDDERHPLKFLHYAWHFRLKKLPEAPARKAIANFASTIKAILREVKEEMVLKRKCEETRKEYARKSRRFMEWENQYNKSKSMNVLFGLDRAETNNGLDKVVREELLSVELVKKRLDKEEEDYARWCLHLRQKSLTSLQNHLPELFKALLVFSIECSKMYSDLVKQNQLKAMAIQ